MPKTPRVSHTVRALTELRQRILNGEMQGGERLYEVALADMLQASRTPVREAMARLAEEGLLERVRGGGFVVRAFDFSDVVDAIEVRGVLEGTAARLAAERGAVPELMDQIVAVTAELETCFKAPGEVDFDSYSRLNREYHSLLSRLSGSRIIEREIERATHLPFASPSAFLPDKTDAAISKRSLDLAQAQHREIVAAIKAREGARAEALAREHARTALRDVEQMYIKKRIGSEVPSLALVN